MIYNQPVEAVRPNAACISEFDRQNRAIPQEKSTMTETFRIAGYTRISVDDEIDRDNVSIENQKAIIEDFVKTQFPSLSLIHI